MMVSECLKGDNNGSILYGSAYLALTRQGIQVWLKGGDCKSSTSVSQVRILVLARKTS